MVKQSKDRPLVAVLQGGETVNDDVEWIAAWRHIADGCEAAVSELHPLHPRRAELLALMADARRCAQLPRARGLRTA